MEASVCALQAALTQLASRASPSRARPRRNSYAAAAAQAEASHSPDSPAGMHSPPTIAYGVGTRAGAGTGASSTSPPVCRSYATAPDVTRPTQQRATTGATATTTTTMTTGSSGADAPSPLPELEALVTSRGGRWDGTSEGTVLEGGPLRAADSPRAPRHARLSVQLPNGDPAAPPTVTANLAHLGAAGSTRRGSMGPMVSGSPTGAASRRRSDVLLESASGVSAITMALAGSWGASGGTSPLGHTRHPSPSRSRRGSILSPPSAAQLSHLSQHAASSATAGVTAGGSPLPPNSPAPPTPSTGQPLVPTPHSSSLLFSPSPHSSSVLVTPQGRPSHLGQGSVISLDMASPPAVAPPSPHQQFNKVSSQAVAALPAHTSLSQGLCRSVSNLGLAACAAPPAAVTAAALTQGVPSLVPSVSREPDSAPVLLLGAAHPTANGSCNDRPAPQPPAMPMSSSRLLSMGSGGFSNLGRSLSVNMSGVGGHSPLKGERSAGGHAGLGGREASSGGGVAPGLGPGQGSGVWRQNSAPGDDGQLQNAPGSNGSGSIAPCLLPSPPTGAPSLAMGTAAAAATGAAGAVAAAAGAAAGPGATSQAGSQQLSPPGSRSHLGQAAAVFSPAPPPRVAATTFSMQLRKARHSAVSLGTSPSATNGGSTSDAMYASTSCGTDGTPTTTLTTPFHSSAMPGGLGGLSLGSGPLRPPPNTPLGYPSAHHAHEGVSPELLAARMSAPDPQSKRDGDGEKGFMPGLLNALSSAMRLPRITRRSSGPGAAVTTVSVTAAHAVGAVTATASPTADPPMRSAASMGSHLPATAAYAYAHAAGADGQAVVFVPPTAPISPLKDHLGRRKARSRRASVEKGPGLATNHSSPGHLGCPGEEDDEMVSPFVTALTLAASSGAIRRK